jgi:hypothetical protein
MSAFVKDKLPDELPRSQLWGINQDVKGVKLVLAKAKKAIRKSIQDSLF